MFCLRQGGMEMAARKGVVMEIGRDWAIILLPNGEYKRIKTKQFLEVGELYQDIGGTQFRYAIAAVFFLTMILTTIDYFSVQAYAQISSLELGVNRWGRVISVQSKDDNGQRILDTVEMKNDKLEVAVEKIYNKELEQEQSRKESIQKPDLSVTATNKGSKKLEQKMLKRMDNGLQKALDINDKQNVKSNTEPKPEPSQEKDTSLNKSREPQQQGNQTNENRIDSAEPALKINQHHRIPNSVLEVQPNNDEPQYMFGEKRPNDQGKHQGINE